MTGLGEIQANQRLGGVIPGDTVEVISARMHGPDALQIVFRRPDGSIGERVLSRSDESSLAIVASERRPFDADATEFKLAAEAQRIKLMAGLYIKELLLREDVKRCLTVAPGGLVEQWQTSLPCRVAREAPF